MRRREEKDRPFAGPLQFPDDLYHEEDAACQTDSGTGGDDVITITDF